MNTALCCPHPVLPTARPWWQSLWLDLRAELRAWQASRLERLTQRALEGLSDHTLRDIGMHDRMPSRPVTLGLPDCERGRWT